MNKGLKKILATILLSLSASTLLFGCTSKSEIYSDDTLNIWVSMINDDEAEYTKIADKWSEAHDGMKVKLIDSNIDNVDYSQKESMPDIIIGASATDTEKIKLAGFSDEIPSGLFTKDEFVSKDLWDSVTIDNKQYGVPLTQNNVILFYNKDKVNEVPSSMEDLIEKAEDVGFTTAIDDMYFNYGFISAFGGYYYKYDKDKGTFDDKNIGIDTEGGVKGLKFINDLVNKHNFLIAGTTETMAYYNFEVGDCGFFIGESGRIRTFVKDDVNFGVAKIPNLNGNEVRPLKSISMSVVNKNSSKKDKAWDFLRYFMDESSEYIMTSNPNAPIFKKTLETEAYKNSENYQELYKQSICAEPYPNIMSGSAYNTAINYNIASMTLKQISPKECAAIINDDLKEARDFTSSNKN